MWTTYDPNWREFVISTFQLILVFFEEALPAPLVEEMDRAARRAIDMAVLRAQSEFTPLNTNVRVMHVMMCDWYGVRWGDEALREHALRYARQLLESYRELHAVPEFNSPTYNGVVFTFIGFWQTLGSCEELRALGRELEEGLWRDLSDFWDPAMGQVCGPYSRAYELDCRVHTALPAILYLTGVLDELPPLSIESDQAAILALARFAVPRDVLPQLKGSRGERTVERTFRELAERGDPRDCHALCTATAWIGEGLMLGGMRGSRNTSYQLHPLVAFWRNARGSLSTIKLLRRDAQGRLTHLHTVLMDFTAEARHLSGTVRMQAGQPIVPYLEVESPDLDSAVFAADRWEVCGLTLGLTATRTRNGVTAPAPFTVERVSGTVARVCFPAEDGDVLTLDLRF